MKKLYAKEIKIEPLTKMDEVIEMLQQHYEDGNNVFVKFNKIKLYSVDAENQTFVDDCYIKAIGLTKSQHSDFLKESKAISEQKLSLEEFQEEMNKLEEKYMKLVAANKTTEATIEE